ncbi:CHRD domain-containing protein [Kocuria marina]|uniref:CHRD domain-containing protein n=1 Tax=Kocuria marina TaxID=223184 RepID=UPI0022E7677C|nr:CHRD domain-containing protein [Kocuria marina]
MKKSALLALPTLTLGALALAAGPATAADSWSFQAQLAPVNNSTAAGTAMVDVTGDQATITVNVAGAPALLQGMPYGHAQHIHIGGQGVCAPPTADANGDGVVDSMEGKPFAGAIAVSLTTAGDVSPASGAVADRYPTGGAYNYQRTVTLDPATLQALQSGNAVINVHGADPAALSPAATSAVNPMNPALPLATDVPIACGQFVSSQMAMPEGPADTGVTTPAENADLNAVAGVGVLGLLAAGAAALGLRRCATQRS